MQSDPQKVFQQALEAKGLKCTRQRREILDYLLNTDKHVTSEELYRDLNKKDPTLGRATVFRTLHVMEEAGFVDKILFPNGRHGYEHNFARPHHDHMICVKCSAVIEFSDATIERIQDRVAKKHGFSLLWHRHEIFGHCGKCARKAEPK